MGELVTPDPSRGYITDDLRIWADWNQDSDFDDAGELLVSTDNLGASGSFNISVPGTANLGHTRLRVRVVSDGETSPCGTATSGETEDYTLIVTPICNPTTSVYSFTPAIGPPRTMVTIKGSGFSGTPPAGAVKFNDILATIYKITGDTMIVAEIPDGLSSQAAISVANGSGCYGVSTSNFSVLSTVVPCPGIVGDLLISEVFDPAAGSNHYIEIYNGTTHSIDLNSPANYTIQVVNDPNHVSAFDISGKIGAGEVKVYFAGTNGGLAGLQGGAAGFDGGDEIRLIKNGAIIDRMNAPANSGYNWRRSNLVSSPNPIYTAAEWTLKQEADASLSTADIGSFTMPSPVISFLTSPQDQGCSFSMTVQVSGTPTAYQWKYYNVLSQAWENVTLAALPGTTITGATTATLTIGGNTGPYYHYQFYCEIRSGATCSKASKVARYLYDTKEVYRSNGSGSWTTPANWLMSDNASGSFTPTCTYPLATNCSEVIIRAGDKINYNVNGITLAIDKITIENGGEMEIGVSAKVQVLNGQPGTDAVVDGTLYDRGSSGNGLYFEDPAGTLNDASWTLGNTGKIIKTNTSSVANYRDFYATGIGNIPAGAEWFYRYNGDGAPNVVSSGMFYPNLYFESTAGTYSWNTFSSALTGAAKMTVKGNLTIGGTGTGVVHVLNNNIDPMPMKIGRNLFIGTGSSFSNNSYNGITDATHGNGTGLDVTGDIVINGLLLNNSGNKGVLKLSGTADQDLTGSGSTNLRDVTIANASGTVKINKSIALAGTLSLENNSRLDLQSGNITLLSTPTNTARVGPLSPGAVISYTGPGRFVVERHYPPRRAWRLVTAPVTVSAGRSVFNSWQLGGTSGTGQGLFVTGPYAPANGLDVSPQMNHSLRTWDGTNLVGINDTKSLIISGTAGVAGVPDNFGMFLFVRGDRSTTNLFHPPFTNNTTLRDTGKLQVYSQTFNLGPNSNGYALVGNPFASTVDMNAVMPSGVNINKSVFYTYDPYLNIDQGGYLSFTKDINGFYTSTPPSPGGQSNHLQSSQAFFLERTGPGATITFTENHKSNPASTGLFKPVTTDQSFRVNLLVVSPTNTAQLADGVLCRFDDAYSNEVDGEDARKFSNTKENLGLMRDGQLLSVEARRMVVTTDTLFLRLSKLAKPGYQLRFEAINPDPLLTAMLVDNYLGSRQRLNLDISTHIDFAVNQDPGSFQQDRFFIVFTRPALTTIPVSFINIHAFKRNLNIVLTWKVAQEIDIQQYEIEKSNDGFNFAEVHTRAKLGTGGTSNTYEWIDRNPATGDHFYRVRSVEKGGKSDYSKIVKVTIDDLHSGMFVFPNPITGNEIRVQLQDLPAGRYRFNLLNSAGETINETNFNHAGGSSWHTIPVETGFVKGTYLVKIIHPDKSNSVLKVIH